MPERNWQQNSYRYSFNGKENVTELNDWQDYGMRMYMRMLVRFPTPDPITSKYPELTPYQFASNRPIQCEDLDGLEAYFKNSGEFIRFGKDHSSTAPVMVVTNKKEINTNLTLEQFKNRVYMLSGEGADEKSINYYAHTVKNAKSYGYHGKGFTEEKLYEVIWQDNKYKAKDFIEGLPNEKGTNDYQSYKDAFKMKDDPTQWDRKMNIVSGGILQAEANLTPDPTRGATNWGGGTANYNYYLKLFGPDNIITITSGRFRHNFYNLNTQKLMGPAEKPDGNNAQWHAPLVLPKTKN